VWASLPVPAGSQDGPPCRGSVTPAAATQIIESFTRHGDLVATVRELPAVAEAAVAAGRTAAFLAPPSGHSGPVPVPALGPETPVRPGGPPGAGQAALAVTGYCGPCCCAPGAIDDHGGLLYAACERVLRPGGILAVLIAGPGADAHLRLAGSTVAAATAASLVYAQHIALVHAVLDGDRLDPGPAPAARSTALPGDIRVHSDLLIFTKPGKPVSSAELKDSQPELPGRSRRSPAVDPWVHGEDEGPVS
jgi:hypothetical protein